MLQEERLSSYIGVLFHSNWMLLCTSYSKDRNGALHRQWAADNTSRLISHPRDFNHVDLKPGLLKVHPPRARWKNHCYAKRLHKDQKSHRTSSETGMGLTWGNHFCATWMSWCHCPDHIHPSSNIQTTVTNRCTESLYDTVRKIYSILQLGWHKYTFSMCIMCFSFALMWLYTGSFVDVCALPHWSVILPLDVWISLGLNRTSIHQISNSVLNIWVGAPYAE